MIRLLAILLLLMPLAAMAAPAPRVFSTLTDALNSTPQSYAVNGQAELQVNGRLAAGDWGSPRFGKGVMGAAGVTNLGYCFAFTNGWGQLVFEDDSEQVNVRHCGAMGDGSDDSAAFQFALQRAIVWSGEVGGGTVYVPPGDYRVNVTMASPYANEESITIFGEGPGASALRPWTNTAPVLKLLGRNITLEKLMLKGDILTPLGTGLQLGDTNLATGAVVAANFRDLYILDFDTGLYIEGIDQAHFDGMVIQRCTNGLLASPRWYATSGTNAVMSKVKFTRSVWLGNYGDAITIRGGYAEQIDFDTCVIEQNYGKAAVIQQYNPISGNPIRGVQFRNCFFEFNNYAAPAGDFYDIEFQPALGTGFNAIYSSMIEGCWFQTTRSSHTPIRILNGGDYRIQNNDFISANTYYLSVTNSPVIDLDFAFAKVLVTNGSPQINWVNANRVELKGLTNAAPSLILTNTGRLLFSDGVNAPDLNVYRSASRVLAVEGTVRSIGTAATDQAFLAGVSGDSLGRFTALNSGRFEWGSGSGARTIFMERAGSGVMEMKGASWTFNRANSTDWALQTYATGDTQYRLSIRADGRMEWTDGANPAGISLAPASGNILNLLATYRVQRTNTTDSALLAGVLGESASRFEVDGAGRMTWGDGTGPRTHGSIERSAIGDLTLKTNLVITPGGGITVGGEKITDITGYGLTVVTGALTANVAGLTWVNVRKHGATGDGVTDDTAAILSSIAAAGSGTVYFPSGVYSITNTLYVTNNAVTLRGDGPDSSTIWMRSNGPAMYVGFPGFDGGINDYSRHQFILEDFGVRGVSGVSNQVGIQFSAASRIALTRVFAETFGDEHEKGFFFERWAWWISVQNCKTFDCWVGLLASGNTTNVNIPENSFNAADFSGNTFRVGRYGIILGDPLYSPNTPLLPTAYAVGIRNNSIENYGELGVWVASPWGCIIDNNYIENSPIGVRVGATNWTSRVYDQAKNVSIKNNHIYTLTNSASAGLVLQDEKTCIQVQGGLFATIKENNFMGYKRAAVEIQSTGVKQTSVDGNAYYNYAEVPRVIGPFTNGVAGNSFFHRWLGESWIGSGTNGPDELINNIVIDGSTNLFRAQVVLTNKPLQFAHGANDWKLSKILDENRGLFHGGFSVSNGGINLLSTNGAGYALSYQRNYDPVQRTVIPQDGTLRFSDGTFDPDVGIGYAGATGWLRMWTNIQGYGHVSVGPNPSIWSGYTKYGDRGIYHTSTDNAARPEVLIGYQDGTTNQRVGITVSNRIGIISALASLGGSEIRLMVDDQHAATVTNSGIILPSGKSLNIGGENITDLSGTNLIVAGNKLNVYGLSAEGHTHDASNTVSGQFESARLGSGTSDTDTFLRGGEPPTWDQLSADDIPNLPASRITSGTFDSARMGTGTATTNTFLQGDGSGGAFWGTVPSTPSPTNGIADAPADGIFYGRLNNAWTQPDISDLSGVSGWGLAWIDGTVVDSVDALDELGLTGGGPVTIDSPATYAVQVGSGGTVSTRHRLNLIAATGLTLAISDDAINDESDVTVSIADRDWGDITSTSSGSVWSIDADAVGANEIASGAVGTTEVDDNAVTYAKIQNVTASRVLGRGAGAGDGDPEEITLGTGLSFSGTTLNVDFPTTGFSTVLGNTDSVTVPDTESAETTLIGTIRSGESATFGAGTLATGSIIKVEAMGTLSASGDWADGVLRVKFGSSRSLAFTVLEPDSYTATDYTWRLTAWLSVTAAGASATTVLSGLLEYEYPNDADTPGVRRLRHLSGTASGTLDTTGSNAFDVTWDNASGLEVDWTCNHLLVTRY